MSAERYHYKVVTAKIGVFSNPEKQDQQIQDKLNRLAMEGYELVTVMQGSGGMPRLFMRR